MIRKLLICPWFGPAPPWIDHWANNITRLEEHGYSVLTMEDRDHFNERCRDLFGIDEAIGDDGRKLCDYRCAFGLIFEPELKGFDFWGTTDLDVVYGRVERYVTDEFLEPLDLHSNHPTYVSGPWSLYRNNDAVNQLFTLHPDWRGYLENPATTGWVETEYSRLVESGLINYAYTNWQAQNLNNFDRCRWDGDRLMEGNEERMVLHFRRTKEYPKALIR